MPAAITKRDHHSRRAADQKADAHEDRRQRGDQHGGAQRVHQSSRALVAHEEMGTVVFGSSGLLAVRQRDGSRKVLVEMKRSRFREPLHRLEQRSASHDNRGADPDAIKQIHDIGVVHPDAAVRHEAAD